MLRGLLSLVIDQATVGLTGTDLIRICIQSDVLDKPISTCLLKVSDMTVEKILSCVYKVVQSKTGICLDESLKIDVITVKRPVGAGKWERKRRVINIAVDRLNKKSVISVPMDGSVLCCAKAIIYGLAVLRKDRTAIESYRKANRPALRKKAEELHRELNLPLEPCGLDQIPLFENKLGVQICVISSDNFNKVCFNFCFYILYYSLYVFYVYKFHPC